MKLPAATVLGDRIADVPEALDPVDGDTGGQREISYRRRGRRRRAHLRLLQRRGVDRAVPPARRGPADGRRRRTRGCCCCRAATVFCNGIHLNVIEARRDPAAEAWRNINAIDDVCREIITCTGQLVVAAVGGNAGAGGVMLALGADQVLLRAGVVLNPHYRTMGLFGSEYWTYVLPRRVGDHRARRLTEECLPLGAAEAVEIGLADAVLPGDRAAFDDAVLDHARALAEHEHLPHWLAAKAAARDDDEQRRPLETYRVRELAEMSHDIFDDRSGFAAARRAFVTKQRPSPLRARPRCGHGGRRRGASAGTPSPARVG